MSHIRYLFLAVIAAVGFAVIAASASPDAGASDSLQSMCGVSEDDWFLPKDFRLRDSTRKLRGRFADGKQNHLDPAVERMDRGVYNLYVRGDIEFLLRRWPNHYLALQALIRFEAGGGQMHPQRPSSCYFDLAQRFAPDDVNVLLLKGIYNYEKDDHAAAEAAWLYALRIEASSSDAHYNLGLLYFNTKRFDEARKHAVAAYDAGYPLPGLRNKLISAGQWTSETKQ